MDMQQFREQLTSLEEQAMQHGGYLSEQQIRQFCEQAGLEESARPLIDAYLKERGIRTGQAESAVPSPALLSAPPQTEDLAHDAPLEWYTRQLMKIRDLDPVEEETLFEAAAAGSSEAASELATHYLPVVADMASEMEEESLSMEDLVQEGNVALWMALESLEKMDSLAAYQACLLNRVSLALREAAGSQQEEERKGTSMVRQVAHLSEAIHRLEDELGYTQIGRHVSLDELSAYLEIPASELEDILRLAGEDLIEGA